MNKQQTKAVVPASPAIVQAYVPFGGRTQIGAEAARPRPDFVTLSWCSGRPAQRPLVQGGKVIIDELTGECSIEHFYYAGFFCDIGEDEELDAALELVGTPKISISHQEGYGEHWMLQRAALYLLAEGLQSKTAMRNTMERLGVAYGWRMNKAGKTESYLYCHVLPRQILGIYNKPLVLSLKGTQTDDVLKLFYRQFEVLRFAHEVLRSQGMDMPLPLWSFAMPAGPAKKQVSRGQGVKSSDIFPVVALVPEALSVEYLTKYEASGDGEHLDLLAELAAQSVEWSTALVARIDADDPFAATSAA